MNLIYYFSGTGNSLKVAKSLANKIGDCEIVNIANPKNVTIKYEKIGIVVPVYASGIPSMVKQFLETTDFSSTRESYFFTVTTFGGTKGSSIKMIADSLSKKNIKLSYGKGIKMYSNYIVMYSMSKNKKEASSVKEAIDSIASDILEKKQIEINHPNRVEKFFHGKILKTFYKKAKNYNVSGECDGCGICKKICPSKNIDIKNNKPGFGNKCEQCVACIQWCPKQAINYKNKTQNRGRYTHPEIKVSELFLDK